MPVVRSGVLDSFGQIRYRPGFLLLFLLLLRLELGTWGRPPSPLIRPLWLVAMA
jgi:hypothetical protein